MKARKDIVRMGTKVGAVLGGMTFLAFGIIPGFYFGSYGTLVLLNHLFGTALQATVLFRAAIAAGAILGITCVAFGSIVVGAIFGTAVGYASEAVAALAKGKAPAEAAAVKAK